jgi:septal ring factor EnvC (AmiA/AmiB activator)
LIRALSSPENVVRLNQEDQENRNRALRSELERLDWQLERARRLLVTGLQFDPGFRFPSRLDSVAFKSAAAQNLATLLNVPDSSSTTNLDRARRNRDKAQDDLRGLETQLSNTRILIDERKKSANYIRAELPEAWARLTKKKNPICPICAVPIDKALAEGCKISTATCDLEALQNRITQRRADLETVESSIRKLEAEQPLINSRILAARRAREPLVLTVTLLERALSNRSASLQAANRLIDDAQRYEELLQERAKAAAAAEETTKSLNDIRDTLTAHREAVANIVGRLSSCFDAVLHEFVLLTLRVR